jgi:hypothetical protein
LDYGKEDTINMCGFRGEEHIRKILIKTLFVIESDLNFFWSKDLIVENYAVGVGGCLD